MSKQSRSTEFGAHDLAQKLIKAVTISVQNTPNWALLQQAIVQMWSKYETLEVSRLMLLTKRQGGSKKGRKIIKRDFEAAFNTLMIQYFVVDPMYSEGLFRRRFRVSKQIFERVYNACLKYPSFQQNHNAAGRQGIHPLVKVTACFRHIAYGTSADQLDELYQIAETTFLEIRKVFCDVSSITSITLITDITFYLTYLIFYILFHPLIFPDCT